MEEIFNVCNKNLIIEAVKIQSLFISKKVNFLKKTF